MNARLLTEIEGSVRRLYPQGTYEAMEYEQLDAHLDASRLQHLVRALSNLPKAQVELEPGTHGTERSHTLYLGLRGLPTWGEFNRIYSASERRAALERHPEGITYWFISLSRVGPFWMSYWNSFRLQEGRIVPELVAPPATPKWRNLVDTVRMFLSSQGITEIEQPVLDQPLEFLTTAENDLLRSRGFSHPTVYHCLFGDF